MKIIKQKRKSITLKINDSGELIVKAPIFCTHKQISEFVHKHHTRIEKQSLKVLINKQEFRIGASILYKGREYKIMHTGKNLGGIIFDGLNFYTTETNQENMKDLFIAFYKKEAKKYICMQLDFYTKKLGLKYNRVRITSARTRWGSCTSKKNLNFSWRLIMAPTRVVDYVILHELAHLTHMNHSMKFWGLLDSYMTQFDLGECIESKKWLKDNSLRLSF